MEVGDADGVAFYGAMAKRVRESFRAKFWNPLHECLFDVLTPEGPDSKIRPNQIFAVSLRYDLWSASSSRP